MAEYIDCIFSFECLSAHLEDRKCPSLSKVKETWGQYALTRAEHQTINSRKRSAYIDACRQGYIDLDSGKHHSTSPNNESWYDQRGSESSANTQDVHTKPDQYSPLNLQGHHTQSEKRSPSSASSPSTKSLTSVFTTKSASPSGSSNSSPPNEPVITEITKRKHREQEKCPIFITWNTFKKATKSLRGCIGTFEPQELEEGLRTYALTSAFEDVRFAPIALHELPYLECSVTLLTDFETIHSPMDWEVGRHGIKISFSYQSRRFGATYLPDVAKEQGWTKTETLISLMRKAGWTGNAEDWNKVADFKVIRYKGEKMAANYSDWKAWRDWVECNLSDTF